MAKLAPLTIIILLVITIVPRAKAQEEVTWAKRVETGNQVVTTLQFYFHDILSGRNPTAIKIAQAAQPTNQPTGFGDVMMTDDPLTVGPEATSKLVGRARGIYGSAGQTDFGLIMAMSYYFMDGIYNGSSFSLLSINQAMNPVREMSIVGGTGLFRLARGYAMAQTYWFDPTTGDAIVGYNVTVATNI